MSLIISTVGSTREFIRSSNVSSSQQQVARQPPRQSPLQPPHQSPCWIHPRLLVLLPVALVDHASVVVVTDVKTPLASSKNPLRVQPLPHQHPRPRDSLGYPNLAPSWPTCRPPNRRGEEAGPTSPSLKRRPCHRYDPMLSWPTVPVPPGGVLPVAAVVALDVGGEKGGA